MRAALDARQLVLELGDAVADAAAIELERALAGALAADAAAHAVAAAAALAQPRREVAQPRDLDLQARLAGLRVAVEDLEDHARAIEHVDAGRLLEVALLGRREVVIDEDDLGARAGGFSAASRRSSPRRRRVVDVSSSVFVVRPREPRASRA